MPLSSYKSVSEVLKDPRQDAFFKAQMKKPDSPMAKAVKLGTKMHRAMETGEAKSALVSACLESFCKDVASDIDEIWGQEEWVAHALGYRGKFDGVGVYRGKLTLFDFKKTNKQKTQSQMNGYFLQMAAYSQAHDFLYSDHAIEQICVFNVHGTDPDNIKTSVFSVSGSELLDKVDSFNNRVKCM
jgi:ATP-dependent exoDNAse (exonuclease V) beta subunit